MKYKKAKLSIDGMNGIVTIHGWAEVDNHWNGWSYVLMNKDNAKRLADKLPEAITYDKSKDEFVEVFDKDTHESEEDLIHWPSFEHEELGKVYSIGSGYWCWTHEFLEVDEDSLHAKFAEEMQKVYGNMLKFAGVETGDISPEQLIPMQEAEEKLNYLTRKWIMGRVDESI